MVYKGLGCIEAGRVPHIDYVYVEAIFTMIIVKLYHKAIS